jgi:hypothetical protein
MLAGFKRIEPGRIWGWRWAKVLMWDARARECCGKSPTSTGIRIGQGRGERAVVSSVLGRQDKRLSPEAGREKGCMRKIAENGKIESFMVLQARP